MQSSSRHFPRCARRSEAFSSRNVTIYWHTECLLLHSMDVQGDGSFPRSLWGNCKVTCGRERAPRSPWATRDISDIMRHRWVMMSFYEGSIYTMIMMSSLQRLDGSTLWSLCSLQDVTAHRPLTASLFLSDVTGRNPIKEENYLYSAKCCSK